MANNKTLKKYVDHEPVNYIGKSNKNTLCKFKNAYKLHFIYKLMII